MFRYLQHSEKLLNNVTGRNGIDTIKQKSYWMREILCDMIPILANTGLRPGREVLNLKWKNLSIVEQNIKQSQRIEELLLQQVQKLVDGND